MSKKTAIVSLIIIICYLCCCYYITNNKITLINIKSPSWISNGIKPVEMPIAQLTIENIGINKFIYNFNSELNNVEKNVTILDQSILPNKANSIIFLAAHSGNSSISYFEKLYKLKINDTISFKYKNNDYLYQIVDIYEEVKNGYIGVNKRKENQLILTTCSPLHKNKQLIIDSILIKVS